MDPSQRSFWQRVGWHKSKAIYTHLVNAVNCLEKGKMVTWILGTTGECLLLLAALTYCKRNPCIY